MYFTFYYGSMAAQTLTKVTNVRKCVAVNILFTFCYLSTSDSADLLKITTFAIRDSSSMYMHTLKCEKVAFQILDGSQRIKLLNTVSVLSKLIV